MNITRLKKRHWRKIPCNADYYGRRWYLVPLSKNLAMDNGREWHSPIVPAVLTNRESLAEAVTWYMYGYENCVRAM